MILRSVLTLTALLLCFGMGASLAQDTAEPQGEVRDTNLPELISLARTRSPQVKAAQFESQKAAVRVDEAAYGWTPKFQFQSAFAPLPKLDEEDVDFAIFSSLDSWGIFARQELNVVIPVFTFFKLTTAEELANIGLDVARLQEEQVKMQVSYDVVRGYYGLQLTKALENVADEAQGLLGRAERTLDELLEQKNESVDKRDRYRLQVAQADFDERLIQLRQGEQLARDALRIHTRLERFRIPKMNFRADKVTLKTLEEVQSLARRNRLDMQMLQMAVEAQRVNVELETLRWFPDFAVAGSVNYSFSNAVEEPTVDSIYISDPFNNFGFRVGLVLEWNVDPVNRSLRVERAGLELSRLEQLRELAWRAGELEVEEAYFQTELAFERVSITKKARRAAKRLMTQDLADYEVGGGDVDQLVRSLTSYFERRIAYVTALHNFRLRLARLQLITGVEDVNVLLAEGSLKDYEVEGDEGGDEDED